MICEVVIPCFELMQEIHNHCLECRVESNNKKIPCKQRKKRYNLINDKKLKVVQFHVDGYIVKDEPETKACDYLYYIDDRSRKTVILVELKGTDIKKAYEQILSTINTLRLSDRSFRLLARIICKSVPNIQNGSSVTQLKKELKRRNVKMLTVTNNLDEQYSNL